MDRSGEKWGWTLGWLGGFIWVLILSVLMLIQGRAAPGVVGLTLAGAAVLVILASAPWKHPGTPYWQLMLPVYAMFFASLGWALWCYDGPGMLGLSGWSVFLLLPILTPFATVGRKRWSE